MDDLIGLVNEEILKERVNTVRNQREQIRERMQNPGLYERMQAQQAPTQTLTTQTQPQVRNPTYRPAGALQKAALSDLYNQSHGESYSSGSAGEGSTEYSGPTEGLGLNSLMAGILGNVVGMGAGKLGAPGPIGGLVSGITSALLGKGDPSNKVANSAIKAGLTLAFPQLAPVIGLASMFGLNMRQGLAELFGIETPAPGYEGGFFGTQGIGSGIDSSLGGLQGVMGDSFASDGLGGDTSSGGGSTTSGYDSGDLGTGISGGYGLGSTEGIGYGTSLGGLQGAMEGTFGNDYGLGGYDYGGGSYGGDYGGGGYSSGDNSYGGSSGNE